MREERQEIGRQREGRRRMSETKEERQRSVWTGGNRVRELKRSKRETAQKTGRAGSVQRFWSSTGRKN